MVPLEELLNPGTNDSADYENPATDDMIVNVNVPVVDSSDTNTDSIIPDSLETAEDIPVDVTNSVASINDPATDDMIIIGMSQDVNSSGANEDTYPAPDDTVNNEVVAVDNTVTKTEDMAEGNMDTPSGNIETADDIVICEDVPEVRENQLTGDDMIDHPAKRARTEAHSYIQKQVDKIVAQSAGTLAGNQIVFQP